VHFVVVSSQHRRRARKAGLATMCALTSCLAPAAASAVSAPASGAHVGSLIGHVTGPTSSTATTTVPVAGVTVTATGPTGVVYTTSTTADGDYDLEQLPAAADYSVTFRAGSQPSQTQTGIAVTAGSVTTAGAELNEPVATVTGVVTGVGRPLDGMPVGLNAPGSTSCASGGICGPTTTSAADGTYVLHIAPGSYELAVQDGSQLIDEAAVDAEAAQVTPIDIHLPAASVPLGTLARHARRDLRWLNAERARAGLPAGVVLNPRWSQECAAHDAYEQANGVLTHTENPQAPGASPGGSWAGLTSVLAQSRWTQEADPWQSAPIHLLQLFSPSLSVIGIDDGGGLQCATTYPGLLRAPVLTDTVFTYPADGTRGVPPSEKAREAPFVPGQFVGIPAGRTTGRDLFVYLNLAGQIGQAQVKVLRATLSVNQRPLAIKWVDNSTRTVGQYLTGAILIPVSPLHVRTTYRASVTVQDRSSTLTHTWSFTTGAR
jgi:hypothetical protein